MKKLIAVLIAVMLVFSAVTAAFAVSAEDAVTDETTLASEDDGSTVDLSGYPEWLQNLITKLIEVFTKLLIKFGIKLSIGAII